MATSPINSEVSTSSYSVQGAIIKSTPSLSPAAFTSHTFNAADVNRKVTETLLLKTLARTNEAKAFCLVRVEVKRRYKGYMFLNIMFLSPRLSQSPLLLPKSTSGASSTAPALAKLAEESSEPIVKASALYALAIYLSNRQVQPTPTTIERIVPVLVNAALTSKPRHTRAELNLDIESQEEHSKDPNSALAKHIKRKCGWTSGMPWGEDDKQSVQASFMIPTDMPPLPKPSSFTDSICRVEGSGQAMLKILKSHLKRPATAIEEEREEDEDGELVVVKTGGGSAVVSSSVTSPKPEGSTAEDPGNSIFDTINATGEQNKDGVIAIKDNDDEESTVASELTLYEDTQPLSLTSIRRAGVAGLACIAASLFNNSNTNSSLSATKALAVSGGLDALLLIAYYEFSDFRDPTRISMGSSSDIQAGSLTISNFPGSERSNQLNSAAPHSARSSLSSHSNTSFSSSVISSTIDGSSTNRPSTNKKPASGPSVVSQAHRNEVNAYLTYQLSRRDAKTAEIVAKLSSKDCDGHASFLRILDDKHNCKVLTALTDMANSALSFAQPEDLKRIMILRTSRLRRFLERSHPTEWAFLCECDFLDFFEMLPPSAEQVSQSLYMNAWLEVSLTLAQISSVCECAAHAAKLRTLLAR